MVLPNLWQHKSGFYFLQLNLQVYQLKKSSKRKTKRTIIFKAWKPLSNTIFLWRKKITIHNLTASNTSAKFSNRQKQLIHILHWFIRSSSKWNFVRRNRNISRFRCLILPTKRISITIQNMNPAKWHIREGNTQVDENVFQKSYAILYEGKDTRKARICTWHLFKESWNRFILAWRKPWVECLQK